MLISTHIHGPRHTHTHTLTNKQNACTHNCLNVYTQWPTSSNLPSGFCDPDTYDVPTCTNCTQSMGEACQLPCINGVESPPFSQICVCDPCYSGAGCDVECSYNGNCTNGTCVCDDGYKGSLCDTIDCPGNAWHNYKYNKGIK